MTTTMTTPALSIDGVSLVLGGRRVLDHASLTVEAGSWTTIIGPNGAGKTSLLRAAAGLVAPEEGAVDVFGRSMNLATRRENAQRLALMPQNPVIPPAMTVADYVLLGRTPYLGRRLALGAHDLDVAERVIDQLDLTAFRTRFVAELSGGELQRVVMARTLAQEPDILLLDEPTSGLDLGHQQDVLELIDEQRHENLTVLGTLHDLGLAAQYSTHVALMIEGRIVTAGPPAEVISEKVLADVYGASVRVIHDGDALLVVPRRPGGSVIG